MSTIFRFFAFLLLVFNVSQLFAQLRLPRLLSSNAVLQRDLPLPLRGQAAKNSKITLNFAGNSYRAKADKNGHWQIQLPAMPAGGPFSMEISDGREVITLKNILIGDIWVCSGQSNMEWPLRESNQAEAAIAAATDPMIRHFYVDHTASFIPLDTLKNGDWKECSPATAGNFTAVGYFFAKHLREKTGVPIGLLHSSWGGSRIEPWMDAATLGFKDAKDLEAHLEQKTGAQKIRIAEFLRNKFGDQIPTTDNGIQNGKAVWAAADLDDSNWQSMELPGLWEGQGWDILDGIVWFRKEVTLTATQAAQAATVGLAMIDDSDEAWINGVKVGGLYNSYSTVRSYKIPAGVLREGKNTLAVRVEDTGYGGGFHGNPELLYLKTGEEIISLAGQWKMKVGKAIGSLPGTQDNQLPTKLYNAMIKPIQWFPIKGVIWYQGESNANNPEDAMAYQALFQNMIRQWRKQWGVGDFPFLFAQLANFHAAEPEPGNSNWALLRESQSAALALPNTAQAVITDIGDANDIHPRNKKDVGYRLALGARRFAYGEKNLIYSGPTFASLTVDPGSETGGRPASLRLQFNNRGSGLIAKGDRYGYLRGFAIAGADRKFVWAKALIQGDQVVVWSEKVSNPVAVRYGWADNPDDANLFNAEGLPASPFRTDQW
ncbi:MAG: beta galactosidase jelly roll domain-containing protein [Saprospiraceae bacterium]|nr:beta galactosidase jelly roll domain-containing protein [Saprospiraceae bacterium]